MTDALSTSKMLRMAHDWSDGDIVKALEYLQSVSSEHANASNAIFVLKKRARSRPGSTTFSFGGHGLVLVA